MGDRISTFGNSNYITGQIVRLESNYSGLSIAETSGLKAQTFGGIASDARLTLDLQSQYSRLTIQTNNATNAKSRVNTVTNSLSNISDVITNALSSLSTELGKPSNTSSNASLSTVLSSNLNSIVGALNAQYAGGYVFSGSNTDTAPVDTSASGYTGLDATTPNTSYYQGDNKTATVEVSDGFTVDYGVTANDPAFEQVLRALSLAVANPTDKTILRQSYDLLQQGQTGVANLNSIASAKGSALDDQIAVNESTLNYFKNSISDLTDADTTQVTAQLSTLNTQINAAYSVLSKLLSFNLASFLK